MLKSGRHIAPEFIRLLALEKVRSLSFGRDLLSALLVFVLVVFVLIYLLGLALFLGLILQRFFDVENVPAFLNVAAIFYLLTEFLIRLFIQKKPLFDLNRYLHLPIKKSGIIHFLLARSLVSPFSLLVIILFAPITITDISPVYGPLHASIWLGTLFFFSIALHFFVLWLKEVTDGSISAILSLFALTITPFFLLYFGIVNAGEISAPFFALASSGPLPLIAAIFALSAAYLLIYSRYLANASLDSITKKGNAFMSGSDTNLFSRFGAAGIYADVELKLILRHKKSRGFLFLSCFGLLYGFFMYRMPQGFDESLLVFSELYLFIAILIISIFFINYSQFLLSWNSASFDFFMVKRHGLEAFIRGKLIVQITISFIAYLISLPYIYFGWEILMFHTVALLYIAGIGIHFVTLFSFWEPKPMDINKRAMFNYDGIGISQFLMAIPFYVLPFVIYSPVNFLFGPYTALVALGLCGLVGIAFYDRMISYNVRKLIAKRHRVSSTFRQGT